MAKVTVKANYVNNWTEEVIETPHSFNFPSSRVDKMDSLHEWIEQYYEDRQCNAGYPKPPSMFYIVQIDERSIFNI